MRQRYSFELRAKDRIKGVLMPADAGDDGEDPVIRAERAYLVESREFLRLMRENVLAIKRLLYGEGFTIAGAEQHLLAEKRTAKKQSALPFLGAPSRDGLKRMRHELKEILGILSTRRN